MRVVDGGDGQYYAAFVPVFRGVYAVAVSLGGVGLKNSPYPLVVSAAETDAAASYVTYAAGVRPEHIPSPRRVSSPRCRPMYLGLERRPRQNKNSPEAEARLVF